MVVGCLVASPLSAPACSSGLRACCSLEPKPRLCSSLPTRHSQGRRCPMPMPRVRYSRVESLPHDVDAASPFCRPFTMPPQYSAQVRFRPASLCAIDELLCVCKCVCCVDVGEIYGY